MSEPSSSKQIAPVPRNEIVIDSMKPEQITYQMQLIKQVMKENMEEGHDYGIIPGTPKPTLLKPGAEKLRLLFFLAPEFDWRETELPGGHKAYEFSCKLSQINTGKFWGSGVGSCSTMESKYRYRKSTSGEGRVENPDIANEWNTALKMAKKRSFVDAILTVTSASAIFTQDVEDLDRPRGGSTNQSEPKSKESAQSTTLIVPPDEEGVQTWRSYVKRVVNKSGQGAKGPWHMVGVFLPGDTGDYWVSTFDKPLGKRVAAFANKMCDLTVKPGAKEGSWDLLDITFPKISQAKEAPVVEQEANGDNDELPIDYGETVEANPFNEQEE